MSPRSQSEDKERRKGLSLVLLTSSRASFCSVALLTPLLLLVGAGHLEIKSLFLAF